MESVGTQPVKNGRRRRRKDGSHESKQSYKDAALQRRMAWGSMCLEPNLHSEGRGFSRCAEQL